MSEHRVGVLWVCTSAVAYSLFTVFSKSVLHGLRPTDVLFWRFAIAAPAAWAAMGVRRARRPVRTGGDAARVANAPPGPLLVAGVVFGVVALCAFLALDHLSAALYTVIIYTYPGMVSAGAWLLGRRPPSRTWVAVGITLVGIALTVPRVFTDPEADGLGLVFTIVNAVVYAAYVLGTGRIVGADRATETASGSPLGIDGLGAATWSCTGSLLFAVGVLPFVGLRAPADAHAWWGLVGLSIVSTLFAGAALFAGMRRLAPTTAALVATLEPVLTLVWAMLLLHESLVALQVVGAAFVVAGVIWASTAVDDGGATRRTRVATGVGGDGGPAPGAVDMVEVEVRDP